MAFKKRSNKIKTFVYIDPVLLDAFTELARSVGASRSEVLALALHEGFASARTLLLAGDYQPAGRGFGTVSTSATAAAQRLDGRLASLRRFGALLLENNPKLVPSALRAALRSESEQWVPPLHLTDLQVEGLVDALIEPEQGDLQSVPGHAPPDEEVLP